MNVQEHNENDIYCRSWLADKAIAGVFIIHGLGEHCQRYNHLAKVFTANNINVYSLDLPGHGLSAGIRGHIQSFDEYQTTVLKRVATVREQLADKPLFLIGHSMGGLIASRLLLSHQDKFAGALLSGPAIKSPQEPPAWQVSLIKGIAKVLPKAGMIQLDASGVSRDKEVVDTYMNDPLVSKAKLSAKFLVELTNAMEHVQQRAKAINLPIRIMHGTADAMTDPDGSKLLFENCGSQDKELKLYEGLYHEIFNEPEQAAVFAEMIAWINERLEG